MSRKDYRLIADAIRESVMVNHWSESTPRSGIADVAERIADKLASDNYAFRRSIFMQACGLES